MAIDPEDADAVRSGRRHQVKAHREVDAPLIRFLSPTECVRLVNAADGDFRSLLRGAFVTGAPYGELGRMRVADFSASNGMITVRLAKGGKPRHVALNDEGRRLFEAITAGRRSVISSSLAATASRGALRISRGRSQSPSTLTLKPAF